MILKYKSGIYPTTMQMYFDQYKEEMYKEMHAEFVKEFKLCKLTNKFKYQYNEKHKFYVNFSAYLILDPETNTVVDYAFTRFNDLVWIFQILNIDGLEIEMNKKVFAAVESDYNEYYKDRLEIIEK